MALCACKCLNVTLGSDKIEDNVDIRKLELSSTEQRDIFFSEKLLSTPLSSLKSQVVQPALICQRAVGRWALHSCLACGQITHAVSQDRPSIVLIPKATQTTQEKVNNLKKSSNFSPVFNLLVPEVTSLDTKENMDTNNIVSDKKGWQPAQQAISTLSKQLSQTLQSQLESIEETVRQFRDQKYAEFEAYRDKAQRDHKILASIVSKTRESLSSEAFRVDTSLDNGPPSPQLPPLQRRRLSSYKDAKKTSHNIVQSKGPERTSACVRQRLHANSGISSVHHSGFLSITMDERILFKNKDLPQEEDSLDAEDIFDIEGTDSRHNMISDQDYYDSDADVSHDEGIHVSRGRGAGAADLARSLPISVPVFPHERAPRDLDDDEEPTDIAASIKALARSVHGDVFDLPRPRFSTQI